MMSCLKSTSPLFSSQISITFSPPKRTPHLKLSFSFNAHSRSPKLSTTATATQTTIEHVVLYKVKDNIDQTKVNAMITSLNALKSLDPVRHLTASALHRTKCSPLPFTHMLHARYSSKDDLNAYAVHPNHVAVVKEYTPIRDDIMAIDWVADNLDGSLALAPGSAIRVTFLKLKENLGAEVKDEILGGIKGINEKFSGSDQFTCGENFSTRARGFSIASLALFPGLSEMEAVDSKEEWENLLKEKVRDYLENLIVLDYVVPSS